MPKIKNIIIFVAIAAVFALIYIFFLKPDAALDATLVSAPSSAAPTPGVAPSAGAGTALGAPISAGDFLTLLLNVKNIKLEDAIFADPAFQGLRDSSIVLEPDGNEGRPNPFAPLGQDITPAPAPAPAPLPVPESEPEEELELDQLLDDLNSSLEDDAPLEDDSAGGII